MNLLAIGGCHIGNYAISPHLGFIQKLTEQLEINRQAPVYTTCHSMVSLNQVADLITQHESELMQADLIILQLGHYELSWRKRFRELFQELSYPLSTKTYQPKQLPSAADLSPISFREQLKNQIKAACLTFYKALFGKLPYLKQVDQSLKHAFTMLAPYQDKVVVMTPFPSLNAVDQWLRRESLPVIYRSIQQNGFLLIDTFRAIPRQKPYFLTDGVHLNASGHAAVALLLNELPVHSALMEEIDYL
ncbi:SGNH/GDSL hydrolase family protein [Spirosoma gilvum]